MEYGAVIKYPTDLPFVRDPMTWTTRLESGPSSPSRAAEREALDREVMEEFLNEGGKS